MKRVKLENQMITVEAVTTVKPKNKLYIGIIQDETGKIQKIFTDLSYDNIWLICAAEAKMINGFWEVRDLQGREIDGNFRSSIELK